MLSMGRSWLICRGVCKYTVSMVLVIIKLWIFYPSGNVYLELAFTVPSKAILGQSGRRNDLNIAYGAKST